MLMFVVVPAMKSSPFYWHYHYTLSAREIQYSDLKAQADALFSELGMNLTTAFNIFVRQSIREGGIPFEISINQPNKETIAAMLEAERIAKDPSVKGYNDLDELFADLKK
jgi:DNA-damage-inducible protein J